MTKKTPASSSSDDRVVTSTDNNPPEAVNLISAGDIPEFYKAKAKDLVDAHLETFLMFLRVPDEIEDQKIYDRVTTLNGMVKKAFDAIDKARSTAKKPYLDGGSAIDKVFALTVEIDDPANPGEKKKIDLLAEMKKAHASLKARQSAYDTKIYKEQEAQRTSENEALIEAAAQDGIVLDVGSTGSGKMQTSRSEHGGMAIKNVEKTFEIIDPSLVPANLCSPDPVKIKAMIDAGAKEIPGVKIDVAVKTHVR